MNLSTHRRTFLRRSFGFAAAAAAVSVPPRAAFAEGKVAREAGSRIKLGLNAYSFDKPLRGGQMTLAEAVHYCAQQGLDAIDATGYYFPGYPKVPSDESIYAFKRTAFLNGIGISGTGVRNDFTLPDAAARKAEVQLVKDWIEAAAKLGAPVIRAFSGKSVPDGYTFDQVLAWMVPDFKECAAYGKLHGVIVGVQNHNDFLKTAAETIRLIDAVDSEWCGSILDVGSLRTNDPYEEIEKLAPYAVSWQLKENVGYGTKETPTDLKKVKAIIDKVGYRGFLPIEALGSGDHRISVAKFLEQVRPVFGRT
jgi:sugar phosphate isomerase/epimerase